LTMRQQKGASDRSRRARSRTAPAALQRPRQRGQQDAHYTQRNPDTRRLAMARSLLRTIARPLTGNVGVGPRCEGRPVPLGHGPAGDGSPRRSARPYGRPGGRQVSVLPVLSKRHSAGWYHEAQHWPLLKPLGGSMTIDTRSGVCDGVTK